MKKVYTVNPVKGTGRKYGYKIKYTHCEVFKHGKLFATISNYDMVDYSGENKTIDNLPNYVINLLDELMF